MLVTIHSNNKLRTTLRIVCTMNHTANHKERRKTTPTVRATRQQLASYVICCRFSNGHHTLTVALVTEITRIPVPDCVPRPHVIVKKWKPAGYNANRVMAAASAYIMADQKADFKNLPLVWKGKGSKKLVSLNV